MSSVIRDNAKLVGSWGGSDDEGVKTCLEKRKGKAFFDEKLR